MDAKWHVDAENNRIVADDPRETIICLMSASCRNPDVMRDAKVIAAAPELLETLLEHEDWLTCFYEGLESDDLAKEIEPKLTLIRAAISKALG